MAPAHLHTCEHTYTPVSKCLSLASDFGMVVTQQKLTDSLLYPHPKIAGKDSPGFSYFSLGWNSSNGSFCGSPYPAFSELAMSDHRRQWGWQRPAFWPSRHQAHKAGSQAGPDEWEDGLTVHSGGMNTVKITCQQQPGPQMLRATGSAVPNVWEVDLVVTHHFRSQCDRPRCIYYNVL